MSNIMSPWVAGFIVVVYVIYLILPIEKEKDPTKCPYCQDTGTMEIEGHLYVCEKCKEA